MDDWKGFSAGMFPFERKYFVIDLGQKYCSCLLRILSTFLPL